MTARRLLIAGLLLALAGPAAAQSPFALTGPGADVRSNDARSDGRGGWCVAESDTLTPSFYNVAGLPGLSKVAVAISGYGERSEWTDAAGSRTTHKVFTPNLRFGIPFGNGRGAATVGFEALRGTQAATEVVWSGTLPNPDDPLGPEIPYEGTEYRVREGTQFQVPIGLGWRFDRRLAAGVTLNLVNGVIRERVSRDLGAPVDPEIDQLDYMRVTELIEDDLEGLSWTWSLLLDPTSRLSLGATYTTSHNLDVTRTRDMTGLPGEVSSAYETYMPETWTVGGQYVLGRRWVAGVEYEATPFSGFAGRADWEALATDGWRVSAGLERVEAFRRRGGMGNRPLRLGVLVRKWPYRIRNEDLMETRLSVGSGLTFRGDDGHLDVALSYGWVGDEAKHGIETRTWRLTVSLVGLEKWMW